MKKYTPYTKERIEIDNKAVYRYWKERCGLVNGNYARKVLNVGCDKFRRLIKEHDIKRYIKEAPAICFKTHLYNLKEIYNLKEKLEKK